MSKTRKNKKINLNRSVLEEKWSLAPYGGDIISNAKDHIEGLRYELHGFASLLDNQDAESTIDQDGFYGISLILKRMSDRLGRIQGNLENATQAKGQ